MVSKYEKMYLISEQEYNMRLIQPQVTMPTYKTPDMKAEEHSFKTLGDKYETKANQLYKEILKWVNDKNEWYEKRDDTLPIAGTNIVDLISYAVKDGIVSKPYSWSSFVEFLKTHPSVPHALLTKKVSEELEGPKAVPLSGTSSSADPTPISSLSTMAMPQTLPLDEQPLTPPIAIPVQSAPTLSIKKARWKAKQVVPLIPTPPSTPPPPLTKSKCGKSKPLPLSTAKIKTLISRSGEKRVLTIPPVVTQTGKGLCVYF